MVVSFYNRKTGQYQKNPPKDSGITSVTNKGQKTTKYDSSGNKKSSQTYKPQTQETLNQLQSGELKSSGDVYIVGGEVTASKKTADAVEAYKNQQIQERVNKQTQKNISSQQEYLKRTRPYADTYAQARMYVPPNTTPKGEAVPTYAVDPITRTLTPTIGYRQQVPVSYLKSSTSTKIYGSKLQKADVYTSEKVIKNPSIKLYEGVIKPVGSKYIDYATMGDKPYATQLKQATGEGLKYTRVMFDPDIYKNTYGKGGTREPTTYKQKASVFFGGAVIGAVRYSIDKPVSLGIATSVGVVTSFGGGAIASIGTKSAIAVKTVGIGLGTVYGGMKLGQTIIEPNWAKKGMIVGETGAELVAFSAGSQLGKKGLVSAKKYYGKNFGTDLKGSSTQYYSQVEGEISKLTPKHTQTNIMKKPTVTIYEVTGKKGGKPFKMVGVQTRPGQFQNIYLSGRTGTDTFTGIIKGGKTTPMTSDFKYFNVKGKFIGETSTIIKPSYLNVKKTISISYTPDNIKNLQGTDIGMTTRSNTNIAGSKNIKEGFLSRTVETFKGTITNKANTRFQSQFTERLVGRKTAGYGDRTYKLLVGKSIPTKIKFANKFSSPKDISISEKIGNIVVGNEPKTVSSLRYQRGGQLSITQTNTQNMQGSYTYKKGFDENIINQISSFFTRPISGKSASITIGKNKFKTPEVTVPESIGRSKTINSKFRIEGFTGSENINVPITSSPTIFAPILINNPIISRTKSYSRISVPKTRPIIQPIVSSVPINKIESTQIISPISKQNLETKPITITKTSLSSTQIPITNIGTWTPIPPEPIIPPPPIISGGGLPFFWPGASYGTGKKVMRKITKQPKVYTPSGFAAAFNIKGKATKFGIKSGLGLRPIKIK